MQLRDIKNDLKKRNLESAVVEKIWRESNEQYLNIYVGFFFQLGVSKDICTGTKHPKDRPGFVTGFKYGQKSWWQKACRNTTLRELLKFKETHTVVCENILEPLKKPSFENLKVWCCTPGSSWNENKSLFYRCFTPGRRTECRDTQATFL